MAKRTKKLSKKSLKLEALEQRQLLAGIVGGGEEVLTDLTHPNGNVYDQVLMTGASVTVTADAGQVTRVSFLDMNGDVVQAEFSGDGKLTVALEGATTKVDPVGYNQDVQYVQGLASFTIEGSTSSTHFQVFSVGSGNAFTPGLFDETHKGGDNHIADVSRVTIVADPANPNGSVMGSIRAGNAHFSASSGVAGIAAANVHVQELVRIGDLNATGSATPTLVFGQDSQFGSITVHGGALVSENGSKINNTGSNEFRVSFVDGQSSDGVIDAAEVPSDKIRWTGHDPFAQVNQTITLTTGVDTAVGGGGNDTINGTLDQTGGTGTLSVLDTIDGGAGNDTLNIVDLDPAGSAQPAGVTLTSVETVSLRSAGAANIDTSTWDGVTTLNVTQGTAANVTAGDTTGIAVAGITGAVTVNGGSSVAVTTSGSGVTIGGTTEPVGAITVTHNKQGANDIAIDGGSSVGVTATGVSTGTVTIGAGTEPSGNVTISSTGAAYTAGTADTTLGAIALSGGAVIEVTQKATSSTAAAATDTTKATITQSAVTITGTEDTTSVTVTQDAAVTAVDAVAAVAGSKETNVLTFAALAAGETTIIGGLTFTAAKALTAAEVAAAFAGLSNGTANGPAAAANGVYTGTLTGWTSGSASTDKVTFTATATGNVGDLDVTTGDVDPAVVKTDGADSKTAVTGKMGVVGGAVTITDGGDDTITTVALTGYGAASITSDALTSLSLASSAQPVTITNTAATSLSLTLNGVTGGVDDANGKYTSISIATTGADSTVALDAVAAKTITIDGTKAVNLTSATLDALETITITGSAGLTIDGDQADTLKAINASGTSGSVTATIDSTKATYSGGSGADSLTLQGINPTKAINLGAGNDTLILAAGTVSSTSELIGGDGTDTLVINGADAQTASSTAAFEERITGFEKLSIVTGVAGAATDTVNVENLDDINYVIRGANDNAGDVLNIDNIASNGTLEISAGVTAGSITDIDLKDATGAEDVFNVVIANNDPIAAGVVNIAGVETINITSTDSNSKAIGQHSMTLVANDAETVVITGNSGLNLTLDAATDSVSLVDGSAMTGALTATGNGVIAQEIRGGSGDDVLTANHSGDVLVGNAGSDTLSVNGKNLVTLTGGAGADLFQVGTATSNVNSYATITDLAAGDRIQFAASASDFVAAAITLDPSTAVFQDYANAAINSSDTGDVLWFQYNGNTYVVQNVSNGASFANNSDIIVKISGVVDLSTASFSGSADTLLVI